VSRCPQVTSRVRPPSGFAPADDGDSGAARRQPPDGDLSRGPPSTSPGRSRDPLGVCVGEAVADVHLPREDRERLAVRGPPSGITWLRHDDREDTTRSLASIDNDPARVL